jgi:hypothetical protein
VSPSKKPYNSFGLPFWFVLGFALFVIFGFAISWTERSRRKTHQTEATNNLRQVGLALSEFENEYGAFPNGETKALIEKKHATAIPLGGN